MKTGEIPLSFYHDLHLKLWVASTNGILERRFAENHLGKTAWVRKELRPIMLRELEILGLIKVSKERIMITKPKNDRETMVKKAYRQLKFY